MAFYQNSVLNKFLKLQDQSAIEEAYKKFVDYFHNPEIQKNIRESKEEQFQEGFLRELYVNVLGYCINPNPDYNLTTEYFGHCVHRFRSIVYYLIWNRFVM